MNLYIEWKLFSIGIDHTDDLNYLFPINNVKFADLQLHNTAKDETMINIMVEMWTNFVKDGWVCVVFSY